MCGIAGIQSSNLTALELKTSVSKMLSILTHRGPDSDGIFESESICIGARRLSIVDLDMSNQPIFNETKKVVLVFNGEIYNFCEIREFLLTKGHIFYTNGDGEVIIHAYEEWGENFLAMLDGMYAFALWDCEKKTLILARDRFGEKPLYYSYINRKLVFASELNALMEVMENNLKIDYSALVKYLTLSYIPAPQSPYKGILKLLPGHYLILKNNSLVIKKYWEPRFLPKLRVSFEDAVDTINHFLHQSISERMKCNVPIGIFLSGGLDSSLITAIAQKESSSLHTFSVGISNMSTIDESNYSKMVSESLGTIHHLIPINLPTWDDMEKIIRMFGEPFADTAAFPTFLLSKLAKEFVGVVLTGDGGDELFGGYSRYQQILHAPNPMKINSEIKTIINKNSREGLLMGGKINSDILDYDVIQEMNNIYCIDSTLDQAIALDLQTYFPDNVLFKVDITTMANSLEARCPFLDLELVSFVLKLPDSYKINNKETKSLLRSIGIPLLPESIRKREKQGFSVPLKIWIEKSLREPMIELLCSKSIEEQGFLNISRIKDMLTEHFSGMANHAKELWVLLILELWLQSDR